MMESTFQIAACECPDINASAFGIDVNGRYALLTGRKGMLLIDLDGNPESRGSNVIETKSPQVPIIKRLVRNSKYDPTAVHFNRHITDLFALTTYQIVEVFSVEDLNPLKPKLLFRGHSRSIADIEWSHFSPFTLASCSADCLTNLWDVRDGRRPTASLTSVSGPTQVRFSKTSDNLLATSHDLDVRIWDIRHPSIPVYYIAAHLQKINGMDWNPSKTNCEQDQLITCSQDNTIKLWDLCANKIKPRANFATKSAAWRIRYTPISSKAILTSTLPQLRSRNECFTMKLWSMKGGLYSEQNKLEPLFALTGHTDVIVDFDWRARPASNDLEIVSWSKDRTLRIWRLDPQLIELNVEHSDFELETYRQDTNLESGEPVDQDDAQSPQSSKQTITKNKSSPKSNTSNSSNRLQRKQKQSHKDGSKLGQSPLSSVGLEEKLKPTHGSSTDDSEGDDDVETNNQHAKEGRSENDFDDYDDSSSDNISSTNELRQEFNLLNKNIPNLEFEELNSLRRICLVTARAKSITCRLRIALPPSYPHTDCPTFTIIDDSNQYGGETLPKEAKDKLLSLLDETAQSQLSRGRNCLEPCLRKFIAELQKQTNLMLSGRERQPPELQQDYQKDDPISISAQRDHSIPFPPTSGARFCGNLLVCFGRPIIPSLTKQSFGEETSRANWLVETPRSMAQLSAQLDNMRRQGSYHLSTISISHFYYGAMRRNELQNRNINRNLYGSKYLSARSKSILQAQTMSKTYNSGPVVVYNVSDLLGGISRELADKYVFDKDVIRMCRLNAEVASRENRKDLVQIWSLAELSSEGIGDRPWTLHPFGSKLIQSLIDHFVNNCHDVQTAAMLVWTFSSPKVDQSQPKFNILSPDRSLHNDLIMHVYAELLYKLNLLNQRAMVLKNIGSSSTYNELFTSNQYKSMSKDTPRDSVLPNLTNLCYNPSCGSQCRSVQCTSCKKYSLYCSICRLPVKGSCSICMKCLHGGHVNHFDVWFNSYDYCPTGCGCECLK